MKSDTQEVLTTAKFFAYGAHAGQVRKYTGEPYHEHCVEVAALAAEAGLGYNAQAVAMLHDVVEDTRVTDALLSRVFPPAVAWGVWWLTDQHWPEPRPKRATRKGFDRVRLSHAAGWVQTVKVCDLISNTRTIAEHDPKFSKTYLPEKAALLRVLKRADESMLSRAWFQLQNAADGLGIDVSGA